MAAVDDDARRRAKVARRVLWSSVATAVVLGALAVVIALVSSTTRAEEVAERVAPEVIRQVVQDSRAQRATNARVVLGAANRVLAAQRRPTVADPGPSANAEQILAAASSAQVLSVLPDDIAERLGGQGAGDMLVLPSADSAADAPSSGEDGAADVAPGTRTPGTGGTGPGSSAPGSPASPPGNVTVPAPRGRAPQQQPAQPARPAQPAPAPSPRTTERRLIPPVLPFDFPLLGT